MWRSFSRRGLTRRVAEIRRPQPAGQRGQRGGGVGNEVVPIVINGVMYVAAGNLVAAVKADTGDELWRYQLAQGSASSRGVNYWPGAGAIPPRIIFTAGRNLVALN